MKNIMIEGSISYITLLDIRSNVEKIKKDFSSDRYALHIKSLGGDINSAIEISDLLQKLGNRMVGFGHIEVASSALLIHQSCLGDRVATPNTRFLLHGVLPPKGKEITEGHRKAEYFLFEYYAKMTGRTIDEIYSLSNKNIFITSYEAREFGFITKIIDHPFPS